MQDLLRELRENNIAVSLDNNDLKVKFNGLALPRELMNKLRDNKEAIVAYLKALHKRDTATGILPVNGRKCYPLSSSQFRLWVLSQYEGGNIAYNMPGMYVFEGEIDMDALNYAFNALIERHESLRTVFKEDEQGEVKQFINPPSAITFTVGFRDLRQEAQKEELVQRLAEDTFRNPFSLASGPLLRAGLLHVEDKKWIFTLVMHHIIGDGWSMGVLVKDVLLLYNARRKGEANPLPPLRIQYKDYVVWQLAQLSGEALVNHKSYWSTQFEGELPVLELPADRVRPTVKTYNGASVNREIDPRISNGIKRIAQDQGGTLFMGLLAAVNALLYRYTNQEDIIIGTSIFGRDHADLEDQIGFYVNTLPLRVRFKGGDNYKELLEKVRQVTTGAYEHQVFPFYELVDELHLPRDMSRNPLFDVMMIMQNTKIDNKPGGQSDSGLKIKGYEGRKVFYSKFDLTLDFVESGESIYMSVVYNKDLFNRERIARFANRFRRLLAAIIEHPSAPLEELDYLSPEEKQDFSILSNEDPGDRFNSSISNEF
jgi:condensation domain-containing protein/tubulysin polyketide synthase-like protein